LVDVAGESRIRITIVEDVTAEKIIARIKFLAVTMRKKIQDRSGEARSKEPYLENCNLSILPLTPGRKSRRRRKNRRSIIVDDAISIDMEINRRWLSNSNLIY
jgi:hypothetical protein